MPCKQHYYKVNKCWLKSTVHSQSRMQLNIPAYYKLNSYTKIHLSVTWMLTTTQKRQFKSTVHPPSEQDGQTKPWQIYCKDVGLCNRLKLLALLDDHNNALRKFNEDQIDISLHVITQSHIYAAEVCFKNLYAWYVNSK